MGHRLSRIYTRTGDAGDTGLADGRRVPKTHPRVVATGDVDELNSCIGLLLTETLPAELHHMLTDIQHSLFDLGAELALPERQAITDTQVDEIEQALDRLNSELSPLKDFILPGGTRPAALAHMARSVCRRAERSVIALHEAEPLNAPLRKYLNRLSDLLFVMGRWLNKHEAHGDVLWKPRTGPDEKTGQEGGEPDR